MARPTPEEIATRDQYIAARKARGDVALRESKRRPGQKAPPSTTPAKPKETD